MIRMIANCTTLYDLSPFIQNIIQVIVIICFFIRIAIEGLSIKEGIVKGVIIFLTFLNYRICDESGIFILAVTIMAAKNMDVKKIVKSIVIPMTVYFAIIISLYFIGYLFDIESLSFMIKKTESSYIVRHTFFYYHPNVFAEQLTWIIFMWLYLKYEKWNTLTYLIIVMFSIFLYYFPNSRTNAVILLLIIVVNLIYNKISIKKLKLFSRNIFNICLILSMVLMILSNTDNIIVLKVNELLTGRIKLGWYTNELFGLTIFGQKLPIGENLEITQYHWIMSYALDNFYYRIIYANGLIITALYGYFINRGLKTLDKLERKKELIFFVILCIFGLSENVMSNIIIAFPLFFLNDINKSKDKIIEENK